MSNEDPPCPYCGSKQHKNGWADRVVEKAGGKKIRYKVQVLECTGEECGRTNRQLPDICMPYKHYEAELIEDVVAELVTEEDLIAAGHDYPCVATMERWKAWAADKIAQVEGWIRSAVHRILDLTDAFLTSKVSLLKLIQERIPQGWLCAAIGAAVNTGGPPGPP